MSLCVLLWLLPPRWSRAWCLAASAALGRVTLALSAFADEICSQVQVGAGNRATAQLALFHVFAVSQRSGPPPQKK